MENSVLEKQTLRILFLASEPSNTAKLHLGKELQEVRNRLEGNSYFEIKDYHAVKPDDVIDTISNYKPHIVHFSGHGKDTGEICLEDEKGEIKIVPPDALARLFKTTTEHVKCVFVNTCFSEPQAKAIAQYVPVVIGTKMGITDTAAIKFSRGFYSKLDPDLSPNSLRNAFERGLSSIQFDGSLQEHLTPILIEGSPEVRFSSEVDSAFIPISTQKGATFQTLYKALTLTGKKMGLRDEVVDEILSGKISKLEYHDFSIKEYENHLRSILREEFPLSDSSIAALLQLQNGLDLNNDDVSTIKNRILIEPKWTTSEMWYDRGRVQSKHGNSVKAIEYFNKAIEKDPDYSGALFERGNEYHNILEYDKAIVDFDKAIEYNNKWEVSSSLSLAYYSKGLTYFSIPDEEEKAKNMTLALLEWNNSINLNPNEPNAYYNRALVNEYFNNLTEAIVDFKRSLENNNSDSSIKNAASRIARCYLRLDNIFEATTWTEIANGQKSITNLHEAQMENVAN